MKHLPQTFFKALFAALLLLSLSANTAFALGQVTLTVKNPDPYEGNHSWFVYEREAGEKIEDVATLKNFSNESATVNVYAVDATSSDTGNFILKFREEEQKGIGYWTEVDKKTITIHPNEVVDVPFSIMLPENITPGQYLGGLVVEDGTPLDAENAESSEDCGENDICGTNVSVRTRIGSRVYLTVPGKTYEDFAVTDFSASKGITGTTKFQFKIENNGNVAYEPKAAIDVYDSIGNLYEHIEQPLGTSSPGTIIHPSVKMENRPIIGNFTAEANVTFNRKFGASEFHSASPLENMSLQFWVMPWEILFAVLLIIITIAAIIIQRKTAFKSYMANAEEYIMGCNDDLQLIAQDRDVPWKKIAKFNKLKPPYVVREGDTLMVPKKKD